jgi:autotransporter-associated beta strand protein
MLNGFITNTTAGNTLTLAGAGSSVIGGVIYDGPGGLALVMSDVGAWSLNGANTYTGGTTVNSGALLVNNTTGSGTGAGSVQVNSPGEFGGTGIVSGNVTYSDGTLAEFTPGSPLTIQAALTLYGNTVVHLQLPATITNGAYILATFNAAGSSGAFAATPIIDNGSLAGGSATVTTANGIVSLVTTGISVPPVFTGFLKSGTNLILAGTGGLPGGTYYVRMSTNLALAPLSLWKPVATNNYGPTGGFTNSVPINPSQPAEFFVLVTQP